MSMKLCEGGDIIDQVCGLEMQIQKYLTNNNRKYQNAHFKQKQNEIPRFMTTYIKFLQKTQILSIMQDLVESPITREQPD